MTSNHCVSLCQSLPSGLPKKGLTKTRRIHLGPHLALHFVFRSHELKKRETPVKHFQNGSLRGTRTNYKQFCIHVKEAMHDVFG